MLSMYMSFMYMNMFLCIEIEISRWVLKELVGARILFHISHKILFFIGDFYGTSI